MLTPLSARATSLLIALVALATIIGAWIFEFAGYAPCELCLQQRWAYYAGVPLALILAVANPSWIKTALLAVAVMWLGSAIFGAYHSGVEWGWWQGPTACSGGGELGFGEGLPDLSKTAVKCNEAAIRIFGLSLAGWNAVISLALTVMAIRAAH
jgi:disulfide bond formation protein DsbB